MKNAINFHLHMKNFTLNPTAEHAISSFNDDIKQLIRTGQIPLYIDGDKIN